MNKTRNILMTLLASAIILELAIVVLYENNVLEAGLLYMDGDEDFMLTTLMEVLTILAIPVSLQLFRIKSIKQRLVEGREKALLKWGTLRLLILIIPMLLDTLLYYMTAFTATFAYMALIPLVALIFFVPTKGRCEYDVTNDVEE